MEQDAAASILFNMYGSASNEFGSRRLICVESTEYQSDFKIGMKAKQKSNQPIFNQISVFMFFSR